MRSALYSRAQVQEGYRRSRSVTRGIAGAFHYALLPLPAQQRRSIYALCSFCHRCGDIAASSAPLETKERALRDQEHLIGKLYEGEAVEENPEAAALAETIRRYPIPREYFSDFLAAVRADLVPCRFRSFADLRAYCYGVASTVSLMILEVLGYDPCWADEARAAAAELGLAMQLTALLRDLGEDAARGRIYLPEVEWREYDLTEADFVAGVVDDRFRAFMAFQVSRVRHHFSRAKRLPSYVPRRSRACPAALQALYSRLLDRIEGSGYDVFRRAPTLWPASQAILTAAAAARSWLLPARRSE